MKIAFFLRHLSLRGTETAIYDYADCNESILGNQSYIFMFKKDKYLAHGLEYHDIIFTKFYKRFPVVFVNEYSDIDSLCLDLKIDLFYTLTFGLHWAQGYPYGYVNSVKTFVHCVFDTREPFGSIYVPISQSINTLFNTNYPVLPHMVRIHDTKENMKSELGISSDTIVFGRYGGLDTFDIDFVKECITDICNLDLPICFLFMNTERFITHPKVIFLESTADPFIKQRFINTTDAMIHARMQGETFGLACGEFALSMKPIISFTGSIEKAHLYILGKHVIGYSDKESLHNILVNFKPEEHSMENNGYLEYTPEHVMKIFSKLIKLFLPLHNQGRRQPQFHIRCLNEFLRETIIFLQRKEGGVTWC